MSRSTSEDEGQGGVSRVTHVKKTITMEGPLSPPSVLAEYERVFPGLAERIISLTESEQKVRHDATYVDMHAKQVLSDATAENIRSNNKRYDKAQWFCFGIIAADFIVSAILAFNGAPWQLVAVFSVAPFMGALIRLFAPKGSNE